MNDGSSVPEVDTAPGRIRGRREGGVCSFLAVPYGAPTGGAGRFMPPRPPEPWAGVRDATAYAGQSPQSPSRASRRPELLDFSGAPDATPQTEDCLTLHVWTPDLDANARRPVMVWLHGGAFSFGSANTGRTAGDRLAAAHDVVVVAVNHRLNVFGHLYLGDIAPDGFADSGNVGILDLVQALRWVRDTVGRFGGDPGNVTIFGVSGGGGKVSTLLAMPEARGLFHRAVVQSGASVHLTERGKATRLAEAFLRRVGVRDPRALQAVPVPQMLAAIGPAQDDTVTSPFIWDRSPFRPVVDGRSIARHPFEPDAPDVSRGVPMMVGDTDAEMSFYVTDDAVWFRRLDAGGLRERLRPFTGRHTEDVAALYEQEYPADTPAEQLITAMSDLNFCNRTGLMAERKAAQAGAPGNAPVWRYSFQWRTPVHEGRLRSPHSIDPPFVFNTLDRTNATDGGPAARALADQMCATWAAFARAGDPNNPSIPAWPPFTTGDRACLVWDDPVRVVRDPHPAVRMLLDRIFGELTGSAKPTQG